MAARVTAGHGAGATANVWARIRGNHALEHATVHLMVRHDPSVKVVGRTTPSGFYLYGPADTALIARSASEALAALTTDPGLAVHPRCGTNLAVTGVLAGLAGFAASSGRARGRVAALPQVLLASLWAVMIAQPLGLLVQKHVTTSAAVGGAALGAIRRQDGKPVVHFVPVVWS